MSRDFRVTIKIVREHFATITVRARDQDEADQVAIERYYHDAATADIDDLEFGRLSLPKIWEEGEPIEHEAVIDPRFRCVDCNKNTSDSGEYYMVADEVWAASGMEPHGGMLCLAHLEERIGRRLSFDEFTAMRPSAEAWEHHVASRARMRPMGAARTGAVETEPVQLELLEEP